MATLTSFQYPSLNPRKDQIRLLIVFLNLNQNSEIVCDMVVVDLDDKNWPYAALSYVWGSSTATKTISLGRT